MPRVDVDAERLVDLGAMRQLRKDDPGRWRAVRREAAAPVAAASAADAAVPAPKRARTDDGPAAASTSASTSREAAPATPAAAASSSSAAAAPAGPAMEVEDEDEDDWLDQPLPRYVQPAKPPTPEGLGALELLVRDPAAAARRGRVLLATARLVVAYDVYPKARRHLLILPRGGGGLDGLHALRAERAPLVREMRRLAAWLAASLRAAEGAALAPMRAGFHAVPSMRPPPPPALARPRLGGPQAQEALEQFATPSSSRPAASPPRSRATAATPSTRRRRRGG